MSQYRECRVELKNVNFDLLAQSVLNVGKQLGYSISIFSESRRIRIEGLSYKVLLYKTGFVVEGDEYLRPYTTNEVAQMIQQEYTALALETSLQELGYNVTRERQEQQIFLYGVQI